ncbi:hypothetical protein [Vibrio phage LP.1]|nr:hypothetical protein [Vibrio phage LP.1]
MLEVNQINVDEIEPLAYATEKYKIDNAYKLGAVHAQNYYYDEELDPFAGTNITSWAQNPYTPCRPSVYLSWAAGFYETIGNLKREECQEDGE